MHQKLQHIYCSTICEEFKLGAKKNTRFKKHLIENSTAFKQDVNKNCFCTQN